MSRSAIKACSVIVLLGVFCGCAGTPEARRDRYLARGKALLQKRQYSRAILEFRNAAKAMPKDAEAYYEIGVASEDSGDVRTAVAFFKKALDENPKHSGAQLKLAQLMSLTTNKALLQDAETRLTALKQSSPNSPELLNSLALTELKLGKTDSAAQELEQVLAKAPQELISSIWLAQTKLAQHDVKGAEDVLKKACEAAPKSADPHVALGQFYALEKRTAEAEQQFQRAVAINPKSGPALMNLANLQLVGGRKQEAEQTLKRLATLDDTAYKPVYAKYLFTEGRRDEAIREFERLAKESPTDRQARTRLIAAYQATNRTGDAQKLLDAALKKNPKDLDALLQRAEVFLGAGKYSQAETDLNEVIRQQPNSAEAHYIRAKLYQTRGRSLTYRQELSEALRLNTFLLSVRLELAQSLSADGKAAAALQILDAAPQSQKSLTPVIVQRNWALWILGDLEELRKGIDQALARERSPDLLVQDGLWKLKKGNPAGARASLEEALKINPADSRALAGLTQTYFDQKQPELAVQKVKEYAARAPHSAPVQEFLGTVLLAHGDLEQARAAFTAAKAADPHLADADLSLAQVDMAEGKTADARKRVQAILSADSNNATASLWLANIETTDGKYDAALQHYRKVVEADPVDAQALNNLAYLLDQSGQQSDEALRYAQKAVEVAPEQPAYCDTLGWVLYHKGLYSEAVRYLERAAASKGDVVWKYHLAMAYAKAGDPTRGRSMLETALRLQPNLPEAKIAQEVLAESH